MKYVLLLAIVACAPQPGPPTTITKEVQADFRTITNPQMHNVIVVPDTVWRNVCYVSYNAMSCVPMSPKPSLEKSP